MGRSKLFKYFSSEKWSRAFLEGELLFRPLSYFRDYEDGGVRADQFEGVSIFRPSDGLTLRRQSDGRAISLPEHSFVSSVKQGEIFVYCLSRSLTPAIWDRFQAVACVEIHNVQEFCSRVVAALPAKVQFPGPPHRKRLGNRVVYYKHSESCSPRWALPDLIASSKHASYSWQDEFRLIFSETDALSFENVKLTIARDPAEIQGGQLNHLKRPVHTGTLADICKLVRL